jgi:mono/diheme cytochrome c family protein
MLRAIVATLSAALLLGASSQAHALTKLQQRGQALAQRLCSTCHAVGVSGFRELGDRLDLATFARTLRRGLESGHQDMPRFKFTREDADAMTAYLRAIQK